MNTTEMAQVKRSLLTFSEKMSFGLSKPTKKFLQDMFYGLAKKQQPILSEIARSLNEAISPGATIKRLSNQAAHFSDFRQLHDNFLAQVKQQLQEDMLVLVDNSDIVKPYGKKFEALAPVRDGSTGTIEKGYMTTNIAIVTPETAHPIPIYSHLFSAAEEQFQSENVETYKGLTVVKQFFEEKSYTLVLDRGYDSNDMIQFMQNQEASFILRLTDRRNVLFHGKKIKVPTLALQRKGKINFHTEIKGRPYDLKISHIQVELPAFKGKKMTMVVVYGYGKNPMKLLTNKPINGKEDVLRIVKGYITRWRIEELFRVQKQAYSLEKVRTLNLTATQLIYQLVNYLIGYYSLVIEKDSCYAHLVMIRSKSTRKQGQIRFFLYRLIRGLAMILAYDMVGIRAFKKIEQRAKFHQLVLEL